MAHIITSAVFETRRAARAVEHLGSVLRGEDAEARG